MKLSSSSNSNVSIVIPTLGGTSLFKTIESINNGIIVPDEILVVIPDEKVHLVKNISIVNVRLIITSFSGQVRQRLEGLKHAKFEYVIQLDDDIIVSPNSIKYLVDSLIKLGPGNVVGPSLYAPITKIALHKFDLGLIGFLKTLNAFILSDAPWGLKRMGKMSSIGIAFGIDPKFSKLGLNKVEWLPGGCVISYKQDLIMNDFFPYPGKAYSEDIIHSFLRKSNGISHYIDTKSEAFTKIDNSTFILSEFKSELNVRFYILNLIKGSKLKLFLWSIFQLPIRFFQK
jgi:glycosyltransferase involved in cell wall biosynthesis